MADEDIDQHFEDKPLTHDTPYTITNLYDLKKEIETIRKEGFALDKEECIPDVSSISASLKSFDKSSIVAAIGIIGPTVRLTDDRIREFIDPLKNCAQEISKALVYK
jgi:DNA-binding IclR family transcriptional regulator